MWFVCDSGGSMQGEKHTNPKSTARGTGYDRSGVILWEGKHKTLWHIRLGTIRPFSFSTFFSFHFTPLPLPGQLPEDL